MGFAPLLWKVRAVGTIRGGKQRILARRGLPARARRVCREAHRIGGLMASDAGATVASQWFKEGMALRVHGLTRQQHPQSAEVVAVLQHRRPGSTFPGPPPAIRCTGTAGEG